MSWLVGINEFDLSNRSALVDEIVSEDNPSEISLVAISSFLFF